MKQVFLSGRGQISVLDTPVPAARKDALLVRTAYSLISAGTEGSAVTRNSGLHGLYEKAMNSRDKFEQVWGMVGTQGLAHTSELIKNKLEDLTALGYSSSGVVLETNGLENEFPIGSRVACMGTGFSNHSEYNTIPKNLAALLPDNVSFEAASFGAVACIAMQGLRRLELSPGEVVVIVGLGLIGQIGLRLATAMGFQAIGLDISNGSIVQAQKYGNALAVVNSAETNPVTRISEITKGHMADGVMICAGAKVDSLINQAFEMSRKRGRVSIVGDIGLGLERAKMYAKELEVRMSCSYGIGRYDPAYELGGQDYPAAYVRWTQNRNLQYFLSLLSSGALNIDDMVSAQFKVENAVKAYASVKSVEKQTFGVLIDYDLPEQPKLSTSASIVEFSVPNENNVSKQGASVGLIGVGAYAKNVHVPNLLKIPNVTIVGVCSQSGGSASVVAKKVKARFATSSVEDLLNEETVDGVVISTRHSTHAQLITRALESGKHVFVEKPMGITTAECLKVLETQKRTEKHIRVGYNRRFSPMLGKMKTAVGAGVRAFTMRVNVGDIGTHWSNTAAEGGRLMGEGVHFFDLANWMLDGFPQTVSATFLGKADALNPNVNVTLGYADGSSASLLYITSGHTGQGKEFFELFGNGRTAVLNDYKTLTTKGTTVKKSKGDVGDKGQMLAMAEFTALLEGSSPNSSSVPADGLAGLYATAICEAAVLSGQTQDVINLDAFIEQVKQSL